MELEDLPWPGELEEEEEEEVENASAAATEEEVKAGTSQEILGAEEEEVEEEGPEVGLDLDLNCEFQPQESTDEEEDEMAKAWLQAHPAHTVGACPPLPPPRHVYAPVEHLSETERAESWNHLPQERDPSQTLETSQTETDVRIEGTKVTDFPSQEGGELAQAERPVTEPKLNFLCSPLIVIQNNFATPDLPLLTCLIQHQEFESDSLFQQSELEFAPLRGIPDKSEDTEWLARPSEVSEALFQATSETSSDLVNSCLSISQHPLTGSTFGSQRSFPSEQENNGENATPNAPDELKSLNDSDNYDNALLSFMSWQMEKDSQQPEGNLADKDQVSASAISDVSDESIDAGRNNSFGSACSQDQYWEQEALQQTEACLASKDQTSFPCENTPPPSEMPYSFLRCMLERGKGAPFTSVNHLKDVCLGAPAAVELRPKMDSFESFEGNEHLQKEFSYFFKQKERRDFLVSSQVHAKAPEIKYIGKVAVPNSHEQVSEAYILSRGLEFSKLEASGGPFSTVKSNLDETSEQLYFQEERTQKAASTFGEKNVDATENVAFEAVIASIESSKQESPIRGIQTDINKPLADDSQEREPPKSDLSPLNYNDENSFMDKLKHPKYQSTPGVFEPAASKPLLHKEDDGGSSLSRDPDLKSPPNAPQNILKGLQGKAESGIVTSYGDAEYSSLYKTADVHSERLAELQRETWDLQGLPGEYLELADLETMLDDLCDSSLFWLPTSQLSSEESHFEKSVDHSNLGISQTFPTPLPSFVPQEPTSESNYPFPRLRMLRISPDTLPTALTAGDTSKGGKVAISQSKLKPDITNTLEDSDIAAHSSLSFEGLSHFAVTPEGHLSEEAPKASAHLGLANQNTGTSPVIPTSYSQREKPNILHQGGYRTDQEPAVLAFPGQADQKNGLPTMTPTSYSPREKPGIFYQQVPTGGYLPEEIPKAPATGTSPVIPTSYSQREKPNILHQGGYRTDQEPAVSAFPGQADQKNGLPTMTPTSYSPREKPGIFYQQVPTGGYLPEEIPKAPATGTSPVIPTSYSQREKPNILHQGGYRTDQEPAVLAFPGQADQKNGLSTMTPTSYSPREKPGIFYQQVPTGGYLPEEIPKAPATGTSPVIPTSYSQREKPNILHQGGYRTDQEPAVLAFPGQADQKNGLPTMTPTSYSPREKPGIFYQQVPTGGYLPEEIPKAPATGTSPVIPTSYSQREKPNILHQGGYRTDQEPAVLAFPGQADQKNGLPTMTPTSYSPREKPGIFYQQVPTGGYLPEEIPKAPATGTSPVSPTSYSQREKPNILHQGGYRTDQEPAVLAFPGQADQKNGLPTMTPTSYSPREKPGIFYQQVPTGGYLPEEIPKAPATGTSPVSPTSYSQREKPNILHQGGYRTDQEPAVLAFPGQADQKNGLPTMTPTSYSPREKPGIFYQQVPTGGYLPEEIPKAPATGTSPVIPTSYSQREKPNILHQDGYRTDQEPAVLAFPGQADQKNGLSTMTPTSYSRREKPGIFYQQVPTGGYLPEEIPKAPAAPTLSNQQKLPTGVSTSYSQSDKPGVFYQHALTGGRLPENIMKTSAAPGTTDQKFDVPVSPPTSYTGPTVFYQQELPKSHLSEETVRGSALPGPAAQNIGITALPSASYSHGEKPHTFYHQAFPESYLNHPAWKVSVAPGSVDQKIGAAVVPSTYSHDVKPGSFPQEELPDRHFTGETQKVSPVLRPAGQKPEVSTVHSSSYSKGMKPGIFYQHPLSDSRPGKEPLDVLAVSGSAEKTHSPTVTFASQPHKETANAFYQQTLSDSHLTEEALPVYVIPGLRDQKTPLPSELPVSYSHRAKNLPEDVIVSTDSGPADKTADIPTVSSSSYQHKKKPTVPYHQELPDRPVPAGTQKASLVSRSVDQKSGTSHPYGEMPSVFYQQELPDSHSTEKSTKTLIPGPADQKTDLPTVPPTSPSHAEKPIFPYQLTLPGSHLPEDAFKASPVSKSSDELSGISTKTSASYSNKERPSISHQQKFPDSRLTEDAQVSGTTRSEDQKTGTTVSVSPTSYSQKVRPGISYQQVLPSHLSEEALQTSATTRPADQSIAMPIVTSTSSSQREKPQIFYQQALPGSHLPGEPLKVSAAPRPPDQNTGAPAVSSSSYLPGEESIIFYQPGLSGNSLSAETFKSPGISGLTDQKTSIPAGPSASGSHPVREKSIIFYQNDLPTSPLTAETLRVAAVPVPTEQKTGTPAGPSGSHPVDGKFIIFLPDGHLPKEASDVLTSPGAVDLKTGEPPVYSNSYFGEKPIVFHHQALSDSQRTEKGHKVSVVSGPADQKTGLPFITSSYSSLELPDRPLTENTGQVSVVPGPTDQKTAIPTVPSASHSYIERPTVSYQLEFPDRSEKALEVLGGAGPTEQKTEIPVVPSIPYYGERPSGSYQQELPDFPEEALQVLGVAGVVSSSPYSKDEMPLIASQQELPDLTKISLKAVGPGSTDQKTEAQIVSSSSREKPSGFYQQELPNTGEDALGGFVHPGPFVQKVEKATVPLTYHPSQELPASHLPEESLKVSTGSALAAQTPGTPTGLSSSYFHREKFSDVYPKASPDHVLTENSLKASTVPGVSDQNRRPAVSSGSHSHKEKHKISAADLLDDEKSELPTVTHRSYLHRKKPAVSSGIGPDDQKTPLPTAFHGSYLQKVKPLVFIQKQLPDRDHYEDIPKISTVYESTAVNTGVPVPLPVSYAHREKLDTSRGFPQELPDRYLTEDALKVSSYLGQAEQISGLPIVSPGTYSHSEKHQLVSEHVQDNLNSPESYSLIANSIPLNSQIDDGVICKPESSGFGDVGYEETQHIDHGSKTLKEIRTLLMEAENIALKRYNFPAPLVPFRDVNDVSFIKSKKVVCFKDPSVTDICTQREAFTEEVPHVECIQKDIGTQTNLNCRSGVENWEFISSTTIRSPLQEAYSTRVAFDETFRQYEASRSVMRSEPEGCSAGFGNKIFIPMMTFIKSDSSSDVSDGCCSWNSNLPESLESVSDVFLNFFPYASSKTSITDSREEDGFSESDDGCGSVDSLAAHVRYLLQCESSLNQAKQILKNAEEEECRVRAHAWNLKFNLGHDCGYSISELNEDDRRKVEEIKAKLFGHGRATHVSEGLCSPQGIGCVPEAVCGHIVIESHEKGCFRTLTAEQPRPDSRHCVFQSVEPSDSIRGRRSPSSWRGRHINLSRSIDQSNTHLKVWNSFQLHSHPPFEKLAPDDIKISKGVGMPFHTNMDSHPLGLVEPTFVPAKEMDFPSPESMKQFTTSITFSSHGHSKYISDTSVFKIGVTTESSQDTGPSLGVFKSRIPEEQISPRDLKQKIFSPSSLKRQSHSPVTILAEDSRQRHKLPADCEHSHQKQKPLERSGFKASHSVPSVTSNCSNFKGVHFSGKDTIISPDKLSSTLEVKEKNVTVTPDLPSCIFIEGRELFEQSHSPHTDHQMRKYSSPSCPDIASCIFLEQRELFEQCKAPQVDHDNREDHSFFPKCQDYVVADLPSDFLDQQQCRSPDVDDDMRKEQFPLSQGQGWVVEKIQHMPQSHFSNMINVDAKVSNLISQSAPDHCTADSPPPSNRKALSCVRITLCPKTSSKLDSGTLDERFHSLDTASKTKINSKCNFDLRTIPSRSLEPTSKLLTCKPIAKDQESLGFLGPESPLDLEVTQSSLPDSKTISQDLKTKLPQNSQIVTSRQTQVNKSDLEGYSKPEGTPVSADGSPKQSKALFPSSSTKLSSDAITQITTESPEKTTFSSEIFINVEDHGQEVLGPMAQKPPELASVCSVQQITSSHGKDGQPVLLPYKPSGSSKMYYVPQLKTLPSCLDSRSDTTIESSHSGSNDAIAPDFPAEMLGTRDDDLSTTVNIKHTEGIYSKRAVTKVKKPPQKDNAGSGDTTVQDKETENLPDTESIKQKEEIHVKRTIPQEFCPEKEGSLEIDISESECHSAFENTTHSVFRSAKFYFHHPVHLPHEQDFCHESLGRSVFMKHSWKDFFHHHSEHSCLPPPGPIADKTKMDYTRIKSLSINLNLGENEKMHTLKNQAKDPKGKRQTNDQKKDQKVTPELTTQCTMSLNELWNKFQERQKQQKSPGNCDKKELSLVERLDRLAKLLQNPITHSLQASESTQDDSRGGRGVRGWRTGKRQHQQRGKLQRKQCKSLERGHNTGDFRKSRVLSHCGGKSNKIKIEQVKLDKYILRKQPDFDYASNTSSDSRLSEESELLTDSPNIFSSTNSLMDSDVLTQTDRDVTLNERSSSISTIDTARLIQAFGQERLYVSPRRIKLYSSVANQQRRYLEKRCKYSKSALGTGYPQMTSEHTRRRHIQEANHISSDSISSAGSFLTLDSTLYNGETVHMLNKGVQAGNLEIVTGTKKYTRDVGVTFPTPSSSEARLEEDSDVTSWSEEKNKEKRFFSNYLQNKNLRKIKPNSCEGVSWFVPVESRKSGSKKENLPKIYSPGIAWFEPVTKNKPWREPLREQNWQKQCMSRGRLGGPGGDGGRVPLRPFVRATLQEALQLHRPDFISRSGERVKRLKLLVQERKLQSIFQSEREALFNTVRPLPRRVVLTVQSNTPIGKKEMIQRTKRIYEQLPEVKKKREEEKRKSDYKSYRLRAQHYKSKVTNRLLGRKVPWD